MVPMSTSQALKITVVGVAHVGSTRANSAALEGRAAQIVSSDLCQSAAIEGLRAMRDPGLRSD